MIISSGLPEPTDVARLEAIRGPVAFWGRYTSPSGHVTSRLDRVFEAASNPPWKSNAASFTFLCVSSPSLFAIRHASCIPIFSFCIHLCRVAERCLSQRTDCDIHCTSNPEFFLPFFSFLQFMRAIKFPGVRAYFTGQYLKIDACFCGLPGKKHLLRP